MTQNQQTKDQIVDLGVTALRQLLIFKLRTDIQRYMAKRNAAEWRDFEQAAAVNNTFAGAGILATPDDLEPTQSPRGQRFLRADVPLGSHELGEHIANFPVEAAAASYAFTVLEVFGNDVARLLSATGLNTNKAWHEDVRGFADLKDPIQVTKARDGFSKHFGVPGSSVPEIAVRRMVNLKNLRNDFAHDAKSGIDFNQYLEGVLAIICHIVFITTDEVRLSVYPFEDYQETFTPQS